MRKTYLTLPIALLAAFGFLLWPGMGAPRDGTLTTQKTVTYSGQGEDVMGKSKFTYVLTCSIRGEKIEGTLKLADHTGKGGTYKLERGFWCDNKLQFNVTGEEFEYHFTLRQFGNHLVGGVVELDWDGLSGLTKVGFVPDRKK